MSKRSKGVIVWVAVTLLTLLLYVLGDMGVYPSRALPLIWVGFSWNFFAYAFDRSMWPVVFVELEGQGKGVPAAREAVLWLTTMVYVALLATLAWAD